MIAAIAIGTALMASNFREQAIKNSERKLENTVLLLARHFDQQFKNVSSIQTELATQIRSSGISTPDGFRQRMANADIHAALSAKVHASSDVAGINVFDSEGKLIASSDDHPAVASSIANLAFFQAFKDRSTSIPILVEPASRHFGGATVIAHTITGPHDEFLGVTTRAIDSSAVVDFLATVALGEDSSITMFHLNGTLLARYPRVENLVGRVFKAGPLLKLAQSNRSGTTRLPKGPIDGKDRIGSVRTLHDFPITLIATTTVSAALADWRSPTKFLILVATLSTVIIAVMLLLIVRQLLAQHRLSQQQLAVEKQRLDTALNNMTHALLMFDSTERLIVSNRRYLEMFGLSPEIIKPGCTLRELIAHRRATGSLSDNADQYYQSLMNVLRQGKPSGTIIDLKDGRAIQLAHQPLTNGGWVTTLEDITERRRSEEQIRHLARYDTLTDLPNRILLKETVERQLSSAHRSNQLAMLYIDIDEFKSINDSLGHTIGDQLLKAVATRLRNCVRGADVVARLGGDEFAVVQTGIRHAAEVTSLVERLYAAIREPFEFSGHHISTDASIGIALASDETADFDQLLKNSDLAMYVAKADGKRTYCFFEPEMDARMKSRHALELDLRQALERGFAQAGFEIYYQPLVSLKDNEITGCEALLRWRHPERGTISPAEFIPVAEESGLISELGEWVLKSACAEAVTWPSHLKLAVNVSPVQFKTNTFALKVASALAASGLPARRLELEITEAILIRDDERALAILHELRTIGTRIALDDFGTGYSSLSYLQRFPFDKIKIDRCFVDNVADSGGSLAIVQAVVSIANARNMTTTAEGVETGSQRDVLRSLGCTEMQGYLFSAAKPADEVRQLLNAHAAETSPTLHTATN